MLAGLAPAMGAAISMDDYLQTSPPTQVNKLPDGLIPNILWHANKILAGMS